MKNKILFFLAIFFLSPLIFFGQFRKIYLDTDSNNEIRNISFITPTEGFVAFENFIGYTQDSGHTFTKKYITINNVDYNGYNANLTFGFDIKGIHVYNKNSFLVYGDYGFVPSILLTNDQGNTFKLIYNSTINLSTANNGIENMVFPDKNNVGFAVETNRILKTVDNGATWSSVLDDVNNNFYNIDFLNNSTGYAISSKGLLKTINGGNSWQNMPTPPGIIQSLSFISENKGWMVINYYNNSIFYTSDGGNTWTIKNDKDIYPVGSIVNFLNDSVGYSIGGLYNIYKTSDSGRIWEPLPRNNKYSYLFYSHNTLYFYDSLNIWAGGGHGFLELSTNGGGTTLPLSRFTTDVSTLNTDSTVHLINYSKEGYQYKWIKNSVQFASSYNASYFSNRQSIDTIQLIVQKGIYSDTSQIIIDTRVNTQRCFATFQAQVDTASVKFTPGYQNFGVKHYWDFGDGVIDSVNASPVHNYTAIGNYTVKHKVFNTIDKCSDSTTSGITIIRTENCLSGYFTYAADSFYTNKLTFQLHFDSTKESGIYPEISWQFGDGSLGGNTEYSVTHTFDSSGYYNVCPTVKNHYTGCIVNICQPVLVKLSDSCNASFVRGDYLPATVTFTGKPYNRKNGKRNIWVINDKDTISTGNVENYTGSFVSNARYDVQFNGPNSQGCGYGFVYEICIDSLNKKMTHIIYDSVTKCSDAVSQTFTVPRQYTPFIKAIPDPNFPYYVSFYAYTGDSANPQPYTSNVWRVQQAGGSGGNYFGGGNNKLSFTFSYPGYYTIAIEAPSCLGANREVYYINYYVAPIACPIYPPDFIYNLFTPGDYKTINFGDMSYLKNDLIPGNSYIWYFGDGDSAVSPPRHTYKSFGTYNVTLKYSNVNGCSKEVTKTVIVAPPCTLSAAFGASRNADNPSQIIFTNNTLYSDSTTTYKWYFGNGDSSSEKNPVYAYTVPGTYKIQLVSNSKPACASFHDTTINITDKDICNLHAGFTKNVANNIVYFKNTTFPSSPLNTYTWDFEDGITDTSFSPTHEYNETGGFLVCLTASGSSVCNNKFCDSVIINTVKNQNIRVAPNPVASAFFVEYVSEIAEPIKIEILNVSGEPVMSLNQQCIAGLNRYNLNTSNLQSGYYIIRITGVSGKKASVSFIKI